MSYVFEFNERVTAKIQFFEDQFFYTSHYARLCPYSPTPVYLDLNERDGWVLLGHLHESEVTSDNIRAVVVRPDRPHEYLEWYTDGRMRWYRA